VYRPAFAHWRRESLTFRSASSMAPGCTSTGSVDEGSDDVFRPEGAGLDARRGPREDAFRFGTGGRLRGAMSVPGR
jgi:hypothetical protein